MPDNNDCRFRASAFLILYGIVFLSYMVLGLINLWYNLLDVTVPIISEAFTDATWNVPVSLVLIGLTVVAMLFHYARIYISLEYLDSNHDYFVENLQDASSCFRKAEFFSRLIVIFLVSLSVSKLFPWLSIDSLQGLTILSALIFLALVILEAVYAFRRIVRWQFLSTGSSYRNK